jgi:hypothetical protein
MAPAAQDSATDAANGSAGSPADARATVANDASVAYLVARLAVLDTRVRRAVERRRAVDPDPEDRFRGLYISEDQVDALLSGSAAGPLRPPDPREDAALEQLEAEVDAAELRGVDVRLRRLQRTFELDALDVELLLVALAPDLHPRYERLYGYLHDDVSRRRASTGIALELAAAGIDLRASGIARARLGAGAALVRSGLLLVEDPDRPFLTRSLRVPDRVAAFLLGDDTPDAALAPLLAGPVRLAFGDVELLGRAIGAGIPLIYVRQPPGASARALAHAAFRRLRRPVLDLEAARLVDLSEVRSIARLAGREARLLRAGLHIGPVDTLAERDRSAVRVLAEDAGPVILSGAAGWDPAWSHEPPLVVEAGVAAGHERTSLWATALGDALPVDDAGSVTEAFRLDAEQIERAAGAARRRAAAGGRAVRADDLVVGARAQNAAGLERSARRIEPAAGWDDLVLPRSIETQLHERTARSRHRDTVLGEWGMGHRTARGTGISALFAGDSGTGKTFSAEVIAADLGFDLYVIDLSTVVDKYIGETEKNLDRIFTEADRVNGVLLFDEADALFGKRSEVKDARDRYANVEVAYLLQRMERFDGLAILTTNLRANVDEAFTRRLDAIIDFPVPEEGDRLRLWERNLPPDVPRDADLDLPFLARRFRVSGGSIRNICVSAAYFAAAGPRSIGMADLIRATDREYRKLGRLRVEAEFGRYFELLDD